MFHRDSLGYPPHVNHYLGSQHSCILYILKIYTLTIFRIKKIIIAVDLRPFQKLVNCIFEIWLTDRYEERKVYLHGYWLTNNTHSERVRTPGEARGPRSRAAEKNLVNQFWWNLVNHFQTRSHVYTYGRDGKKGPCFACSKNIVKCGNSAYSWRSGSVKNSAR